LQGSYNWAGVGKKKKPCVFFFRLQNCEKKDFFFVFQASEIYSDKNLTLFPVEVLDLFHAFISVFTVINVFNLWKAPAHSLLFRPIGPCVFFPENIPAVFFLKIFSFTLKFYSKL
jgi:hypothetical protein